MPYESIEELPEQVKVLPEHAQKIWLAAFNQAYEQYGDEERAFKIAWAAVKAAYRKDPETGKWVKIREDKIMLDTAHPSLNFKLLTETDRELRIPTVFTKEGVQNKALKPGDELAKAAVWLEHRPIVIGHPPEGFANNVEKIVGYTEKVIYNPEAKALIGESVIWKEKLPTEIYSSLKSARIREGSVGYWCQIEASPGVWHGEPYEQIQRNLIFDHYAILPDLEGACPAREGCGLQSQIDRGESQTDEKTFTERLIYALKKALLGENYSRISDGIRDNQPPARAAKTVQSGESKAEKGLETDGQEKSKEAEEIERLNRELAEVRNERDQLKAKLAEIEQTEAEKLAKAKDQLIQQITDITKDQPEIYTDWKLEQLEKFLNVLTRQADRALKNISQNSRKGGLTVGSLIPRGD